MLLLPGSPRPVTKALASGFEETATQRISLAEDDPDIVYLFFHGLYDPDPVFSVL